MDNLSGKYGYAPNDVKHRAIIKNVSENLAVAAGEEVFKKCFSLMDLTTLHTEDTVESVIALVDKANALRTEYPSYPMPASVCVFPNFASVVKERRVSEDLHVTAVSGCFPSSQSFLEVKVRECELAVMQGADEVDIVLALNSFMAGDYRTAGMEIEAMRKAIDKVASEQNRKVVLKVILETGVLASPGMIAEASFLAMESGADFIKTSTGKVQVNATPAAACVMCECIKKFYSATGRKVGFKAAGGISTADEALSYYLIGKTILGEEWMNKDYFRFGVSRLGNSLMSAIEGRSVKFF
ncbi:MAG: deoxyribose-phosphate aldolase [Bacteroidales bacterium]|nr:deoxyribose-phosphate aldolase [Bacteroidales bacterium]